MTPDNGDHEHSCRFCGKKTPILWWCREHGNFKRPPKGANVYLHVSAWSRRIREARGDHNGNPS